MYDVYIIESLQVGDWYKGFSEDYEKRFIQHNNGESTFTSTKRPCKLIFVQVFTSKQLALQQEKKLKHCNRKYLQWLIHQRINLLLDV
jgi:putative endonuclease